MSRVIIVVLFVASPLYLLNTLVMPALDELAHSYANFDQTSQAIVDARPEQNSK